MEDELFNFQDAADFLGISTKTFSKILLEENIPARKVGIKWVFSKKALLEWVSSGSSKDYAGRLTPAEIEQQHSQSQAVENRRRKR